MNTNIDRGQTEEPRIKRCFKCLRELPIGDFYRHAQMADGHLSKCKDCARADVRANYRANLEAKRSYDRRRGRTPRRRAQAAGNYLRRRDETPRAVAARAAVNAALASAELRRGPCEVCGDYRTDGHHDDYAEPLKVRWLCRAHHLQWHAENGPGRNAS